MPLFLLSLSKNKAVFLVESFKEATSFLEEEINP